ncbi:hypothetical protein GGTG_12430 [Gaeumannomyces tritici R3-111a-1]|uniref:Uncharacterized protein n=1 Tax=Gaeumannomyces tritici (strain R3-111a-1) TaxID=644352 RepID=J3PG04_GAET3|nr:hypothetical protein GGTG_12430 [Gaeumannomyces tritici R3-111a-1]EJT70257.1 hypothetical protein GGTG_12430 [Gaeumannomyces tritici R3-111a-1]
MPIQPKARRRVGASEKQQHSHDTPIRIPMPLKRDYTRTRTTSQALTRPGAGPKTQPAHTSLHDYGRWGGDGQVNWSKGLPLCRVGEEMETV